MAEPGHRSGHFAESASPQRSRIREAVIGLVVERGSPDLDRGQICAEAGVSPSWFEAEFESVAACLTEIYLANIAEFDRFVLGAADQEREWRPRLRAAAYAAARYVDERPRETQFDMVQMLAAGDMARAERDRYVRRIFDLIDEGRAESPAPEAVPPAAAEAVFGAIYEMLARRMGKGGDVDPNEIVPELMYIAVRPYLGHEVAVEELSIPPPAP